MTTEMFLIGLLILVPVVLILRHVYQWYTGMSQLIENQAQTNILLTTQNELLKNMVKAIENKQEPV